MIQMRIPESMMQMHPAASAPFQTGHYAANPYAGYAAQSPQYASPYAAPAPSAPNPYAGSPWAQSVPQQGCMGNNLVPPMPNQMMGTQASFPSAGRGSFPAAMDGRGSFPAVGTDGRGSFPAVGMEGRGSFPAVGMDTRGSFPMIGADRRASFPSIPADARGSFGTLGGANTRASFSTILPEARGSFGIPDALNSQMGPSRLSHDATQGGLGGTGGGQFQFKFEAGPSQNNEIDRLLAAARVPDVAPADGQFPSVVSHPPARGRDGVLRRLENSTYGVYQEPIGSTLQLDDCVAACRKEVQAIAAEQRRKGQKYVDPEFPPDDRALYINGRGPTTPELTAQPDQLPAAWKRVSEGALSSGGANLSTSTPSPNNDACVLGPLGSAPLMGALACMRTAGKDPGELIVWREPDVGVYGVRLFKEGEWIYEVLDDSLPIDRSEGLACSRSVGSDGEMREWVALVEKAYAKVHGSYEAAARSQETETIEDVLGMGATRVDMQDFPIWGELWQHLHSRRGRGHVMMAVRRRERQGDHLTSGLISCYGYPLTRCELVDGEMLVELENPWSSGSWHGRWGERSPELARGHQHLQPLPGSCKPFWMSIQDFCKHFTDVFEARIVSPYWQMASVLCSNDRPSYPLISVTSKTQAVFHLTQCDRRWSGDENYTNAIGLRVYRCKIVAPQRNAVGQRQNVSNPFRNLELIVSRPPVKAHSVVCEVARLEPSCLYIVAMDSEQPCPHAALRVLTASVPRFRELSAPESSYFLQAQAIAPTAVDYDSFSSSGSAENQVHTPVGGYAQRGLQHEGEMPDYGIPDDYGNTEDQSHTKVSRMLQDFIASCSTTLRC